MKEIYRQLLAAVMKLPQLINLFKTYIFEYLTIFKKKKSFEDIVWSNDQQEKFDDFWKNNYGKKISNRWHKLYQSVNGEYNIKYFPEGIYSTKVEPKMNNYLISRLLQDKSLVETLYSGLVHIPKTYGVNSSNIFYNSDRNIINGQEFVKINQNIGSAVIKPTIESSSGNSVQILYIEDGVDLLTGKSLTEILSTYRKNYIIQEKIKPHKSFKKIYKDSINTIRLITYTIEGEVYHAPISLRIGTGGSEVDNIHAGGLSITVADNGELNKYAYKLGYGEKKQQYEYHPNSNIKFENYSIPFIPEMINLGYKLHGATPHIGIASWDFTLDSKSNINLIEVNLLGQSVWFPQMLSGESLFGENTEDILKLIGNK